MISQVLITIFLSQQFFDKKVQQTFISNDTISKRLKFNSTITLTNCYFYSIKSISYNGGAIYIDYNKYIEEISNIENCTFEQCVSRRGGSVYINTLNSTIKFKNCIFTKNNAREQGGSISIFQSSCILDNCSFVQNYLQNDSGSSKGGAIYSSNSTFQMIKCNFNSNFIQNNYSDVSGGSIYTEQSNFTMEKSSILNNLLNVNLNSPFGSGYHSQNSFSLFIECSIINNTTHNNQFVNAHGGGLSFL